MKIPSLRDVGDATYYFWGAIGLILLSAVVALALHFAGMTEAVVGSNVVIIMGFASLIMSQYRTAAAAEVKADEVKAALDLATQESRTKLTEVKDALVVATGNASEKLDKIQTTTSQTHVLVNSNLGKVLTELSAVRSQLADLTNLPADRIAAANAKKNAADHDAGQAVVDAGAAVALSAEAPQPRRLDEHTG